MPSIGQLLKQPITHLRPSKVGYGNDYFVPRDKNVVLRQFIGLVNISLNSKDEFQRVINILLQEINGTPDPDRGSSTNGSELFTPRSQVLSETRALIERIIKPLIVYITGNESKYFGKQAITRGATFALYAVCVIYKVKFGVVINKDDHLDAKTRINFVNKTINEIKNCAEQRHPISARGNSGTYGTANTTIAVDSNKESEALKFNEGYFKKNPLVLNNNNPVAFAINQDGYNFVFKFQDIKVPEVTHDTATTPRDNTYKVHVIRENEFIIVTWDKEPTFLSFPKDADVVIANGKAFYCTNTKLLELSLTRRNVVNTMEVVQHLRKMKTNDKTWSGMAMKKCKTAVEDTNRNTPLNSRDVDVTIKYNVIDGSCCVLTRNSKNWVKIAKGESTSKEFFDILSGVKHVSDAEQGLAIGIFLITRPAVAEKFGLPKLPPRYDCPDYLVSGYTPIGKPWKLEPSEIDGIPVHNINFLFAKSSK